MILRPFGSTGVAVPVIGQGTWHAEADRVASVAAIRAGLDAGATHIDTAEMYGRGRAEEVVAEAIEGRRDEVFIVSKVLPRNAEHGHVLRACEASLRRLRTDRLDCYILHWREDHPLSDTIAAFERLVAEGKVRSWGLSNFDVADLEDALAVAGPGRIACNQVLYHLRERAIETAVISWCERNEVAVVAYTPFGTRGFPSPRSEGGRVLGEIASSRGATPRQIALSFLVRRSSVFTIPQSSDVDHVIENAGAGSIELTAREVARIEEAFPLKQRDHIQAF